MKKKFFALFIVLACVISVIRPIQAAELPKEVEENYRIMGMSDEDIRNIKIELQSENSDNALTNTEREFYKNRGFSESDLDLNGGQFGQAIYPPEMIDSGYVYKIYIKGDGY